MMIARRLTRLFAVCSILLLALACTAQQRAEPFTPPEPTAAPDIAATVTARDRALPQGGPEPTPVPASVSQAATEFAASYASLSQEWDGVHRDLDTWRQGLTSCDASLVRVALRGFSGDFSAVSRAAAGLSRHPSVRGMSDQLIEAARQEEAALRRLRDTWQPGESGPAPEAASSSFGNGGKGDSKGDPDKDDSAANGTDAPAPQPGFEGVAQARANALALRQGVADQLSDLQVMTGADAEAQVAAFVSAFDSHNSQWDRFHEDYDTFRATQPSMTPEGSLEGLSRLVDQHRELVLLHRSLPSGANTRYVSDVLAEAVQDEDSALRRLRGSFQRGGDSEGGAGGDSGLGLFSGLFGLPPNGDKKEDGENGEGGGENGEGGMEESPTPTPAPEGNGSPEVEVSIQAGDPGLFDAFDEQLGLTNQARREAGLALDGAVSAASAGSRAAVTSFTIGHDGLARSWDGFHGDYDSWMAAEGGCDRAGVTATIGGFALRMGEIAASARKLPKAAPLRPLGELTVEAAQREEEALRELRGGWSPFDASVYHGLDREITASGKMRRQVSLGILELLDRYGISGS